MILNSGLMARNVCKRDQKTTGSKHAVIGFEHEALLIITSFQTASPRPAAWYELLSSIPHLSFFCLIFSMRARICFLSAARCFPTHVFTYCGLEFAPQAWVFTCMYMSACTWIGGSAFFCITDLNYTRKHAVTHTPCDTHTHAHAHAHTHAQARAHI